MPSVVNVLGPFRSRPPSGQVERSGKTLGQAYHSETEHGRPLGVRSGAEQRTNFAVFSFERGRNPTFVPGRMIQSLSRRIPMLFASDISKTYSERTLFSGLNLSMTTGDHIALIGANGSGKITLLDILAGETPPDTGSISRRRNTTVGYLKQEPPEFAGHSLLQEVLNANQEVIALAGRIAATREALSSATDPLEQRELLGRLSQFDVELEAAGGEDRDQEAKAILSDLGFKESDFSRGMNEFSGGWIMRAELARLLFRKPDLLLLDEPTNHLDLEAHLTG